MINEKELMSAFQNYTKATTCNFGDNNRKIVSYFLSKDYFVFVNDSKLFIVNKKEDAGELKNDLTIICKNYNGHFTLLSQNSESCSDIFYKEIKRPTSVNGLWGLEIEKAKVCTTYEIPEFNNNFLFNGENLNNIWKNVSSIGFFVISPFKINRPLSFNLETYDAIKKELKDSHKLKFYEMHITKETDELILLVLSDKEFSQKNVFYVSKDNTDVFLQHLKKSIKGVRVPSNHISAKIMEYEGSLF